MDNTQILISNFLTIINKSIIDFDNTIADDITKAEIIKDLIEDLQLYQHLRKTHDLQWTANEGSKMYLDHFITTTLSILQDSFHRIQKQIKTNDEPI